MKNYFNILRILFLITFMLILSCDNGLLGEGFQDSPNATGDAPSANLLGTAELAAMMTVESDNSRYSGIVSNYITGVQNQWAGINSYVFSPNDFDRTWNNMYTKGIKPTRLVKSKAIASGNDEMLGSAQLLEAYFLLEIASNWGDVPNTEAFVEGVLNPSYDSQLSVIQAAINLLDEAIVNGGSGNTYFNDGIGGTSTTSSISQLANSLKARAYLLLGDYPNAHVAASNGIQNASGDLFGNHDANVPAASNAYYQFLVVQRPQNIAPTGTYLEAMLNPANVTVSRSLVTPGDVDRYNFYFTSPTLFNTVDGIFAAGASSSIISYKETKLIEAEALYRDSQETQARVALNEVRDALASEFGGAFPHSTATGLTLLNHILEEKYISIFPSAHTFHDLTRTDNMLGVSLKVGTQLPERFLYTQDEMNSNSNIPNPIPDLFTPTPINN